jgi:serine/threonine-protein kinase
MYSLGCVMYEMLTGQPPFTGSTSQSLVQQHMSVKARPVSDVRRDVPKAVSAIIARLLEKDPSARFPTANAVRDALDAVTLEAPARRTAARAVAIAGVAALILAAAVAVIPRLRGGSSAPSRIPRTSIAVLPLQNLSTDSSHAYFAMGLHDELITQLAKVSSLSVRGRASVASYATASSTSRIAGELQVGAVLAGTVQVVGNRLRVRVQLVDAVTNENLWGDTYDRTLDDAFAIQSDVAQRVVAAVGAAVQATERQTLAAAPTKNPEAYRLYLQGRQYWNRPGRLRANQLIAQQFFEKAIMLDSTFAIAHAALSAVHGVMHWYGFDATPARVAAQVTEAQTALRLAPDLPDAHFAMGLADYWARRDYERALHEFSIARAAAPNNAEIWAFTGYVHRRQGQWREMEAAWEKAIACDPRDASLYYNLGGQSFDRLHRYAEALQAYDRALEIAPDVSLARLLRAWTIARYRGSIDSLRALLFTLPREEEISDYGTVGGMRIFMHLLARQPDSAIAEFRQIRWVDSADIAPASTGQMLRPVALLHRAWAYRMKGDTSAARADFEAVRARSEAAIARNRRNAAAHGSLGMALAGLGLRDRALVEARWLQSDSARIDDRYTAFTVPHYRAMILSQAGAADSAVVEIERVLIMPSTVTTHTLRLDPVWDPIRENPKFKALLRKYEPR